jgi:hypothetical protein
LFKPVTGFWQALKPELDNTMTENNSEMKKEAQNRKLPRMAKVHDFLEMWQGSQNICGVQRGSCTQNKKRITGEYILDTEEILEASWSLFLHNSAAAFKLSERSPLPPALAAKYLPGGESQILHVHHIPRINHHTAKSDEDTAPESISDTEHLLSWIGDLDNPNDSEKDCPVDDDSDIEHNNCIADPECPEQ